MLGKIKGTLTIGTCLTAGALGLSACGSSSSSSASYAKTDPSQILKDTVSAMSGAQSFQATGQLDLSGASAAATISVKAPSDVEAAIQNQGQVIKLIVLNSRTYLYANSAFWQKEFGSNSSAAVVAHFANKWFKAPAATTANITKDLGDVTPKQLATCLSQSANQPTTTGSATINGESTVELHLAGGKPGSSPGNLYVATAAPHYPVRFTQTGKSVPGGSGSCANGPTSSDDGKGKLDFSRWNAVTISAPPNPGTLPTG